MHQRIEANIAELSKLFQSGDGYRERLGRLAVIEAERQSDTAVHAIGVLSAAEQIAESLNVTPDWLNEFRFAVRWHDIGKLAVPDEVFRKQGQFTDDEWLMMKAHADAGVALVGPDAPEMLRNVIKYHHESYNGRGYNRLRNEQIPLEARVCQVADVYDALKRKRDYKSEMPEEAVLLMMTADEHPPRQGRRNHDPFILRRFIQLRLQDQNLHLSDSSRKELKDFAQSHPMSDFGKTADSRDKTYLWDNDGWEVDASGHRMLFRQDGPRTPKLVELRDPAGIVRRRENAPVLETDVDYSAPALR